MSLVLIQVDTSEQLKNVSKMKLYRYRYSREYLEHAGLGTGDCDGEDTGVLAQEVKEVLPEAVKESVSGFQCSSKRPFYSVSRSFFPAWFSVSMDEVA